MPEPSPLLDQLHDIQLPEPIGWWPLAFSWWIMIFSVTSILIGILWYYLDLKRRNAYRVTALQQLKQILQQPQTHDYQKIERINRLIKQVAITTYGRNQTAHLHDQEWVSFLADTSSYIPQPDNLLEVMQLAYQNTRSAPEGAPAALNTLATYARKWIKGHHQ